MVQLCTQIPPTNLEDLLVNIYLFTKKIGRFYSIIFLTLNFLLSKDKKNQPLSLILSPKDNFSHSQLPSIALKCYPNITSLPQHTKNGEKICFLCVRYPKWPKVYKFDQCPVLFAYKSEPFLLVWLTALN